MRRPTIEAIFCVRVPCGRIAPRKYSRMVGACPHASADALTIIVIAQTQQGQGELQGSRRLKRRQCDHGEPLSVQRIPTRRRHAFHLVRRNQLDDKADLHLCDVWYRQNAEASNLEPAGDRGGGLGQPPVTLAHDQNLIVGDDHRLDIAVLMMDWATDGAQCEI